MKKRPIDGGTGRRAGIVRTALSVGFGICVLAGQRALGNGGPFVVKYPGGDPAAKGVLARLDPDLRPSRESRSSRNVTMRTRPSGGSST